MATTLISIASEALRESGIIPIEETPESPELSEAVERLSVLITSIFGWQLGEELADYNYGSNGISSTHQTAFDFSSAIESTSIPKNARLLLNLEEDTTLYLPPDPSDGTRVGIVDVSGNLSTNNLILNGNGRKIESSSSVTLNNNSTVREWFYRADTADWVRFTELTAVSDSPFPHKYDDYLSLLLAVRLNPRYGAEMNQLTIDSLRTFDKMFKAQYKQTQEMPVSDVLTTIGANKNIWSFNNFARGTF